MKMNRKVFLKNMTFWSFLLAFGVSQFSSGNTEPVGIISFNESSARNLTGENVTSGIDFDTLNMYGVSPDLAEELKENILKAIGTGEQRETNANGLRQGEYGGVSGGYYQGSNGGGAGGRPDYEDEDESPMNATPGPGLFGILSGLFGVATGLGTLNPTRVIQSTVNFFPPSRRMQVQMIVDSLTGYVPQENRTIRPRPRTPRPPPTQLYANNEAMMNATGAKTPANSSAKVPKPMFNANSINAPSMPATTPKPIMLAATTNVPSTTTNEDDEYDDEPSTTKKSVVIPPMIMMMTTSLPSPSIAPHKPLMQLVTTRTPTTTTSEYDEYEESIDAYANFKPENSTKLLAPTVPPPDYELKPVVAELLGGALNTLVLDPLLEAARGKLRT